MFVEWGVSGGRRLFCLWVLSFENALFIFVVRFWFRVRLVFFVFGKERNFVKEMSVSLWDFRIFELEDFWCLVGLVLFGR